ncbi:hypothetical protein BC629DRAFT_1546318 [Irpex lacteus]|nr:hypothetical protein BC629DRAFT_1546318 [Irpex lacteus]
MSSTVYETLLQELASVLDVINELNASQSSTEIRRKLVQTTNTFKIDMSLARETARNLQGGEFSIEDQESVIGTLEGLRKHKRCVVLSATTCYF